MDLTPGFTTLSDGLAKESHNSQLQAVRRGGSGVILPANFEEGGMMVIPVDPTNPANDPVVQRIALAFLAGFHGEQQQKQMLLDFLNSQAGKQIAATVSPALAAFYERMTIEDEQESKLLSSIAVGVGFAVLTALRERGIAQ